MFTMANAAAGDPLYDAISAEIVKLTDVIKGAAADKKLTITEIFTIVQQSVVSLTAVVRQFTEVAADQRRAAVIAAVKYLYDSVIAPLDIPGVPNFIEPAVDKALGQLIEPAAGAAYDAIAGVFDYFFQTDTGGEDHVFSAQVRTMASADPASPTVWDGISLNARTAMAASI